MANDSVNAEKNLGDTSADRKTEQGFTPGPWKVETPRDREEADGGCSEWDESYPRGVAVRADWNPPVNGSLGYQICRLSGVNNHTLPDARLIAAAPALYQAALDLLDAMEMQEGRETQELHITQPVARQIWDEAKSKARSALARVNAPLPDPPEVKN